MITHTHFDNRLQIVVQVAESIGSVIDEKHDTYRRIHDVEGISGTFTVKVRDILFKTLARDVFFKVLQLDKEEIDRTRSACPTCINNILSIIKRSELEISLRVMDILQKKNLPSSCEYVGYDESSQSMIAFMRKSATIKTQQVCQFFPIYLGPFDDVCEVEQRCFAITFPDAKKPILATWHLAECIGVVGFDKIHKIGFLFHVDKNAHFQKALLQFQMHLRTLYSQLFFDVRLFGGFIDDLSYFNQMSMVDSVLQDLYQHRDSDIRFNILPQKNIVSLRSIDVKKDSYWSRSIRLARSICIDTRLEDPLNTLQSYEPALFPDSRFHKRMHTKEEAISFENSDDTTMTLSYSFAE